MILAMTATVTIKLSDEVLRTLQANKTMTIALEAPVARDRARNADGAAQPREGSLPARLLAWAEKRGKPFRTADVAKKFTLSRAHASMLLSRVANGSTAIRRTGRGVYEFGDKTAPAKKTGAAGAATPRPGSLPDQILEWAAEDGAPFDTAEVMEAFGVKRAHASMLMGKLANGPYPIERVKRGVYQYSG